MTMLALLAAAAAAQAAPAPAEGATLTIAVTGLRNERGLVRACLTADAKHFPDCNKDPHAFSQSVAARGRVLLAFRHVPPGAYAVSLFHDENGNNRLDKLLGIPSEGFGFSRDAPIHFGPPRFDAARFAMTGADLSLAIRVRYIL